MKRPAERHRDGFGDSEHRASDAHRDDDADKRQSDRP